MSDLYERDVYTWANEQAERPRAGDLSGADIRDIAQEIDSSGRKPALVAHLTVLLLHSVKWRFQPMRRGRSWERTIMNAR
jgi:hypothetical protein